VLQDEYFLEDLKNKSIAFCMTAVVLNTFDLLFVEKTKY
jgi:hypothetical protein